jgi:hypothetical protein
MTGLQRAEELLDEAERATQAGKKAASFCQSMEAEQQFQRARDCRDAANRVLDEMILAGFRAAS